jgi:hypothetical protein
MSDQPEQPNIYTLIDNLERAAKDVGICETAERDRQLYRVYYELKKAKKAMVAAVEDLEKQVEELKKQLEKRVKP